MKSIKTRLERLERAAAPSGKEPLVILFTPMVPGSPPPALEPTELYAGHGRGFVVHRQPAEPLDELIARVQCEYPEQPVWIGWYRHAEQGSAEEGSRPNFGIA